jgi:hypothetical protein
VRNVLLRNAIFSSFIVVVPALTPVLLLKELRLDGSSLGLVFASMGAGSVVSSIFVIPWLRSRFSTDALMTIAQVPLAGIYLMAMILHCVYCLFPIALAGACWTLASSELWVTAQRAMPSSSRGRISALMMVLSQGAVTLGGILWGLSGEIAGTRATAISGCFAFFLFDSCVNACLQHSSGSIERLSVLARFPRRFTKSGSYPVVHLSQFSTNNRV